MFIEVAENIDTGNRIKKMLLVRQATVYAENLPESLYMNHYQLSDDFGFTPKEWIDFLKIKEIDRLIEAEIAQIAEIAARRALSNLESGEANSADIQAAKELLANSKLLKQKHNQRPQVILTRIKDKHAT